MFNFGHSNPFNMPLLFSYGTLQQEQVQLETFGRLLQGEEDCLQGYALKMLEITDPEVLRKSGQQFHPILEFSGSQQHQVKGTLFNLTEEEIARADDYEVDDYQRIQVTFQSEKTGFIYVKK